MVNSRKILIGILVIIAIVIWSFVGLSLLSDDQPTSDIDNNDVDSNMSNALIAVVNGEQMYYEEVTEVFQSHAQQGQRISEQQAIEFVINQTVILQEAEKNGYIITDEEAELELEKQVLQRNSTLEEYKQELDQLEISYKKKLQDFKEHITIQNYIDAELEEENLSVTEEELKGFYQFYKQKFGEETPPYEEIKYQLAEYMREKKRQDAINSLVQRLREKGDIEYKV